MRLLKTLLVLFPLTLPLDAANPVQNVSPIDFSVAGFEAGRPLPFVEAQIAVKPSGGDDTALLQSALDHVASLPVGANGFRGAVLLRPGRFHVGGQLRLRASGVVLRGSGSGPNGTTIVAEGTSRRTLIEAGGEKPPVAGPARRITTETVPAGATSFALADINGLGVGDHIAITRPSTEDWIHAMVMTGLPGTFASTRLDWVPGSHNLVWDRVVTAVDAASKSIQVDAPITTTLEARYGGGAVARVQGGAALEDIGIENLDLDSAYNRENPRDEEHAWIAILLDHVEDAWVRKVTARHFAGSAVRANQRARRVTIEDCRSESPISEPAGYRRQSFLVYGQQVFIHRCHSEGGMNDFATGLLAAGPNVFLDCDAARSLGASGAFEGWASGVLYERVHLPDSPIQLLLDQSRAQGAGWTAANSILWNCAGSTLDAIGPPGAPNIVVHSSQSLYETQLAARGLHLAAEPAGVLAEKRLPDFHQIVPHPEPQLAGRQFQIVNGHFVIDGRAAWGQTQSETWWRGNTSPDVAARLTGSSITRFMPGQVGPGLTEDLPELAARLKARGILFYQTIPGLWYEHRRDEHTVTRQPNADAWAPFYEMPWARSGKGTAWDGLSLFDVSRYNPWYFERQRLFARIAAASGLVVFHHLYNTHNVLEIGPHWIDYPWRPANNVNDTGLPEPPPFHTDTRQIEPEAKAHVDSLRLDVANQFYSTGYPPLRKLHHDYIFHVLDELGDMPNVIFTVAYQYAGPLSFEQFFQDTVAEWERQHNRRVRIALITSKQITDAILEDPVRSKQIAAVDMRYWQYRPDGSLWAPMAGENHAFRELIMTRFQGGWTNSPPPTTAQQVYRQVREYRDRYPNIALFPMESGTGPIPILMAGAASQSSLHVPPTAPPTVPTVNPPTDRRGSTLDAVIDKFVHEFLAGDLMKMGPRDGLVEDPTRNWALADDAFGTVLIYSGGGSGIALSGQLPGKNYAALWFDPNTGTARDVASLPVHGATTIEKPDSKDWLLLLRAGK
ncbi:MAG: DUF6298 domain-containing protein [Bryobacteraceae bacterium]